MVHKGTNGKTTVFCYHSQYMELLGRCGAQAIITRTFPDSPAASSDTGSLLINVLRTVPDIQTKLPDGSVQVKTTLGCSRFMSGDMAIGVCVFAALLEAGYSVNVTRCRFNPEIVASA